MVIIPTEKRFDWKHAPVVLFVVVFINIAVFFLYQSGDDQKIERALESYQTSNYLDVEWPLFENYLAERGESELLDQVRDLYDQELYAELSVRLLMRTDFYFYLEANATELIVHEKHLAWMTPRLEINREIASTSFLAYGLIPNQLSPFTLLSHQFLHGDTMHLLGNLFFLIICGFAVEAAIGHLRFLLFYLCGGVAGGLMHAVLDLSSGTTLVGASGAISAVMAMYLGVFRLKKIEFFYWFFIFVGYFRAPALLILPFYIGNELFSFYSENGSSVAFMAHTGGFIAGSILLLGSVAIDPKILNQDYLEEDQEIDPRQKKLSIVYALIEKYRFEQALQELLLTIKEYGPSFDFSILRYNLMKIDKKKGYRRCVEELLATRNPEKHELNRMEDIWNENSELELSEESVIQLGLNLATLDNFSSAESIFKKLQDKNCQNNELPLLAKKIAFSYEKRGDVSKQSHYEHIASTLQEGAK